LNELLQGQIVKWVSGVVLSLLVGTCSGCTMTLTGGGEMSIGMRNDNFLVLRHTVDGDKVNKGAESKLDVPAVVELLTGKNDVPDETVE
jgi:hypothetical protein